MDTAAILQRIMADPSNFLDQILSPVAHELGYDPSHLDGGEYSPEDLIAAAVGNRLAQFLSPESPVPVNGEGLTDLSTRHDQLQARNSALAAALGACDCWGEDPGCGICHGVGRSGSVLPDPRLFAIYVRPAIRTLRAANANTTVAAAAASRHESRSEDVPSVVR